MCGLDHNPMNGLQEYVHCCTAPWSLRDDEYGNDKRKHQSG